MKKQKEDRRVRMTRLVIKETMIELLQEYSISKISVKMLCEKADINRSTFYAHYADQYELLRIIQKEMVDGIRKYIMNRNFIFEENDIIIPVLIQVLEYAKENQKVLKVLLGEHGDSNFQNELRFLAKQKINEEIDESRRLDESTNNYLEIFELAGIISIMTEWLNNGCVDEPDKLASLIAQLLFQGVSGLYN